MCGSRLCANRVACPTCRSLPKNSPDLQESHRFSRSWLTYCSLQFGTLEVGTPNTQYTPLSSAAPVLRNPSRLLLKWKKTKNDWRCLEQHSVKLLQTTRQYAGLGTVCSTEKYVEKLNRIGYRKNARYCCGQRKQYMLMLGWSMSIEKIF